MRLLHWLSGAIPCILASAIGLVIPLGIYPFP
jgi:hypothetical protein